MYRERERGKGEAGGGGGGRERERERERERDLVTKLWGSAEDLYRTSGFAASVLLGCPSLKM